MSGLSSIKQLDIGLRTGILGLKKEYQDEYAANLIQKTCKNNRFLEPSEG